MTSAEILKNEDFFKLALGIGFNAEDTERLILAREGNKMVLAIICEGIVTFHHFGHLEIMTAHNEPNISAATVEKWAESFITFIESGDGAWKELASEGYIDDHDFTASEKNSDQHLLSFIRANLPDVPVIAC